MAEETPTREGSPYTADEGPQATCSRETDKLFAALSKAQAQFKDVKKDAKAEVKGVSKKSGREYSMTYSYATLPAVIEATRQALHDNELFVTQPIVQIKSGWAVETKVVHSSGQFQRSWLPINVNQPPQALGSMLTYYRRYQLASVLGLAADEDDDAKVAQNTYNNRPQNNQQPQQQQPQKNLNKKVTVPQVRRLFSILKSNENTNVWTEAELKDVCESMLGKKITEISMGQYDWLEKQVRNKTFKQVADDFMNAKEKKDGNNTPTENRSFAENP